MRKASGPQPGEATVHQLTASALLVISACSSAAVADSTATDLELITLPVSLYVVDIQIDDGTSSARSLSDVEAIGDRMAAIWAQAGIVLEIRVSGCAVPDYVIRDIGRRENATFLEAIRDGRFELPDPGVIAGFYVPSAGGANGFAPLRSRVFFVTDEPTVHDERVSSHEIGHLLGS
jgi:hypothetical protein